MSDGAMYRSTDIYLAERGLSCTVEGHATDNDTVVVSVRDPDHRGGVALQMTPTLARQMGAALDEALTELDGGAPEEAA